MILLATLKLARIPLLPPPLHLLYMLELYHSLLQTSSQLYYHLLIFYPQLHLLLFPLPLLLPTKLHSLSLNP
ncbi:hypothetical protein L873DRAFT_1187210 [Choiromyces venosus 120613-1]|uniref:Uncharacterized protein n=1 Tax=Choiromyces venosus 120613-1 TaxID=1336337 RepID=A0A3N4KGF7_9PEZI|nr:hypothetical protein L873DRAFT_1187210 [Choiromyces venosus 120613-1]